MRYPTASTWLLAISLALTAGQASAATDNGAGAPPAGAATPKAAATATIAEKEITAVIQAVDAALRKKDLDAALAHVAETGQIRLGVDTAQGRQILPLDRGQYREILATTLADATDYRLERKAVQITPLPDGKTLFTDFVSETLKTPGKQTRTLSQERMLLERIDGQVKITRLESSVLTTQ